MQHSVTFNLRDSEYVGALRLNLIERYKRRRSKMIWLGLVLVYGAILASMLYTGPLVAPPDYIHLVFLVGIMMPLVLYFFVLPISGRKVFQRSRLLHGAITYEWSTENFIAKTDDTALTVAWKTHTHIVESDALLLLYRGRDVFQIIPKRILSAEQIADIKQRVIAANS